MKSSLLLTSLLLPLVSFAAQPAASGEARFQPVKALAAKYCYTCHNSKVKTGDVNLEPYSNFKSVVDDPSTWERVLEKLQSRQMPPAGLPKPPDAELKLVVFRIEQEMDKAERLAKPDPGRITARRLNRSEYNNTVRDLLSVNIRPADDFPQDDSGYGFDNIGDVLSLSPVLMEKYMTAAERVARTAVFGPELSKPTLKRYQPPYRKKSDGDVVIFKGPQDYTITDYDVTGLSMPQALHVNHWFPVEAEYLFRVMPEGVRPRGSDPSTMALWIDGKVAKTIPIPEFDLEGRLREFRLRVPAGEHWLALSYLKMFEGFPASFNGPNPTKNPEPPPPARVAQFGGRAKVFDGFRMNYIEIGGPYDQAKGPSQESLKKIFTCGHLSGAHSPACARLIVTNLARRAYRRPVTPRETAELESYIALAQQRGHSFDEGVVVALQAVLVSPDFLFRIEKDRKSAGAAVPVSQHELASRLSYFLWASMPDEALLSAADRGILRQPLVLKAQVQRMLKDPKSHALVENFGGQWLEVRRLESVKPDRDKFPDFDDYLRNSMRQETELFIEDMIRADRSVLDLLDAKHTFLNERLALLYGIKTVKGSEFRRVDLTGTHRGGILTHASVLTVSSYANRTSPVLRGKWVLENLLNTPPPPPPPNVPTLDVAKVGSSASLRQQLEEHRANAICSSCHSKMDPLGFGLENFDAIGAWRDKDGSVAIDPSGILPDGTSFSGPQELTGVLRRQNTLFAHGMTEKLLTYALGRGLERYDKRTVKEIASKLPAQNHRFSALVMEVVNSMPFQMRRPLEVAAQPSIASVHFEPARNQKQ